MVTSPRPRHHSNRESPVAPTAAGTRRPAANWAAVVAKQPVADWMVPAVAQPPVADWVEAPSARLRSAVETRGQSRPEAERREQSRRGAARSPAGLRRAAEGRRLRSPPGTAAQQQPAARAQSTPPRD